MDKKMSVDTIIECLEKEHFCSSCPNEDSECTLLGCVYVNAAEELKRLNTNPLCTGETHDKN